MAFSGVTHVSYTPPLRLSPIVSRNNPPRVGFSILIGPLLQLWQSLTCTMHQSRWETATSPRTHGPRPPTAPGTAAGTPRSGACPR